MHWHDLTAHSRRAFQRHRVAILLLLSLTAIALALYPRVASGLSHVVADLENPGASLLERVSLVSGLVRDVILTTAALVAGLWTYYVFARGRTFQPRVSIEISLAAMAGPHKGVAVVRVRATNDGNVRIRPIALQVAFSSAVYGSKDIRFERFDFIDDALREYYDPSNRLHLEPKNAVTCDLTTYVPKSPTDKNDPSPVSGLLLVQVLLVDNELRAWRENRVLNTAAG